VRADMCMAAFILLSFLQRGTRAVSPRLEEVDTQRVVTAVASASAVPLLPARLPACFAQAMPQICPLPFVIPQQYEHRMNV